MDGPERVVSAANYGYEIISQSAAAAAPQATMGIVPFKNGELPTMPPRNLPALDHAAAVDDLKEQEVERYLIGTTAYQLPDYDSLEIDRVRRRDLKRLIGVCRSD